MKEDDSRLIQKLRSVRSFCDELGRMDLADIADEAMFRIRGFEAEIEAAELMAPKKRKGCKCGGTEPAT